MNYEIILVSVGEVQESILNEISIGLQNIFKSFSVLIWPNNIFPPKNSFDQFRHQYNSSLILSYLTASFNFLTQTKILGVTNFDLYVPELNFVFGEAILNGNVAIISLKRLSQEFYGLNPNYGLFILRAVKEAIHELGHSFGLTHCRNRKCVMHFSNSIIDTDVKEKYYCSACKSKLSSLGIEVV